LTIGLLVVNVVKPGTGIHFNAGKFEGISTSPVNSPITYQWFIEHLLPTNFADAVVRGDVLQIVIFSTIFAFAMLAVGEKAKPILKFCEALADIMFKFISYIMYLAPIGVCAALASAVADNGWQVIVPLLKLVGTLYLALALFVIIVLLPVCKIFKIPAIAFAQQIKGPVIWAFATTSSESAYPLALEKLESFGIPRRIASFVLPMGYSFNLDGSTLYLSLASVFVAQVAGIDLSVSQQILIMLTLMLTTKGVAAVPRTSIVVLSGTLTAFGLPLEGVALILGVDAFMDMGRSAINLLGNCLATAVIARSEGIVLDHKSTP
jgi:proton glutamate symport protein